MANFRVGQRIKKVRGPCDIGVEATVIETGFAPPEWLEIKSKWIHTVRVIADRPLTMVMGRPRCECFIVPDDWEPIVADDQLSLLESFREELEHA